MRLFHTPSEMKEYSLNHQEQAIGFVPTMGALHEGHLSLVSASKNDNDQTIVSIYVNETQFNVPRDLKSYPISIEDDLKLLEGLGVDGVFLPKYADMYSDEYRYKVSENTESLDRCGKDRPGHFDGVLTVVMKLLNIVSPTRAYFGEKDFQQLSLVKGMVEAFFMDTEIVSCPTARDEMGLALSSRNRKLDNEGLEKARLFASKLKNEKDLNELENQLGSLGIDVDYLVEKSGRRFGAVKINDVRLIDNVQI